MHPRPRIRSSQHIELVFNHQFYDVADREPLPLGPLASLGPIRTARRQRPSPYPPVYSRRSSASPAVSRETSPSSVVPGRAMSPVALRSRASISDLDYAEGSDDDEDGLSQGRAVNRQSHVVLRPEISLDSSSDDWLEHAEDGTGDDGHVADAAPVTAASVNEEHQPSTQTARRSSRASSADPTQPTSTPRDRSSSRARDHAPSTPRSRPSSGAQDRVPSAQKQASSAARTGPSQPQAPSMPVVPEVDGTKIPKPPGAPGRSENGEYDLEDELGWPSSKYRDVMGTINELVEKHLQTDKSVTKQLPGRYATFEAQALARYPELDDYEDRWPIRALAVNHLRYLQNNSKRITRKRPARI